MSDAPRSIFVNRYFWPDHSATSQILSDLAFDLAEHGERVVVIASRLRYDDPSVDLPASEVHGGVEIHRVATTRFGRDRLIGRAIDYGSFYLTATWAAWRLARSGDTLIAKTDPPILSAPIALVARLRGARLIAWLQDLYPELAEKLGIKAAGGAAGRLAAKLRDASLMGARPVVAIGERMADLVEARGIPRDRIIVLPNWTDDRAVRPGPDFGRSLRSEWGFSDTELVVGYSGNLGRAHDVNTILDAAECLQGRGRHDIRFLFIGGGHLRTQLDEEAARRNLGNIVTRPYQPYSALNHSLAVPDIHWLSLLPPLEGLIVPSKFYGAAAAGRSILFIGDPDGEIARIVAQHEAGRSFAIGQSEAVADFLEDCAGEPHALQARGRSARAYIDTHHNRERALARWREILRDRGGRTESTTSQAKMTKGNL